MKITGWYDHEYITEHIDKGELSDRFDEILWTDIRNIVIKEIKTNGYKISGYFHQDSYIPVIDNKYVYWVSLRSWGRVMAEAYDKYEELAYCDWAWGAPENQILPMKG